MVPLAPKLKVITYHFISYRRLSVFNLVEIQNTFVPSYLRSYEGYLRMYLLATFVRTSFMCILFISPAHSFVRSLVRMYILRLFNDIFIMINLTIVISNINIT